MRSWYTLCSRCYAFVTLCKANETHLEHFAERRFNTLHNTCKIRVHNCGLFARVYLNSIDYPYPSFLKTTTCTQHNKKTTTLVWNILWTFWNILSEHAQNNRYTALVYLYECFCRWYNQDKTSTPNHALQINEIFAHSTSSTPAHSVALLLTSATHTNPVTACFYLCFNAFLTTCLLLELTS